MDETKPLPISSRDDIDCILAKLHATHASRVLHPYEKRIYMLESLRASIRKHEASIYQALHDDLGRSTKETVLVDTSVVFHEVQHMIKHLRSYMRPVPGRRSIGLLNADLYYAPQPLGPTLIFAPFNYPFNLTLIPLIGALAAGNPCVIKMSELTPATISVVQVILRDANFSEAVVALVDTGSDYDALFRTSSDQPRQWSKVFFTGSTAVGRIIAAKGASCLASVTLELGGSNPAVVMPSADLRLAVDGVAFGKFTNAGQTCIAENYLIVVSDGDGFYDRFIGALVDRVRDTYYGGHLSKESGIRSNADFCRIVSERAAERIAQTVRTLVGDVPDSDVAFAKLLVPRHVTNSNFDKFYDPADRFVAPTIIELGEVRQLSSTGDSRTESLRNAISNEIFGPVLPILRARSLNEALTFIDSLKHSPQDKPLASYIFSTIKDEQQLFNDRIEAGSCVANATLIQAACPLFFGGVGNSGLGAYHGEESMRCFSHYKPVVIVKNSLFRSVMAKLFLPPYGSRLFSNNGLAFIQAERIPTDKTILTGAAFAILGAGVAALIVLVALRK